MQTRSCPPPPRLAPSSISWVIIPPEWPKANPKKLPATDAIFEQLSRVKTAAETDATVMRISLDAKASVKVGDFSRGGKKRVRVKAADHDAQADRQSDPGRYLGSAVR
jgi:hypothetical protein